MTLTLLAEWNDELLYDRAAEAVSTWQQAEPLKAEEALEGVPPGYLGALSFYGGGQSRQMLLAPRGFVLNAKEAA